MNFNIEWSDIAYLHEFKDGFLVAGLLEIVAVDVGAFEHVARLQQLVHRVLYKLGLHVSCV